MVLVLNSAKPFILKYCQISYIKKCSVALLDNFLWEQALFAKEKIPCVIENYFFSSFFPYSLQKATEKESFLFVFIILASPGHAMELILI